MAGEAARAVLQPIRIGGTTSLRNRLYRAPVLEGAGDGDDAAAVYAKQFVPNAEAGVGLIIQGNSCLYDEGRTSPGMTVVSTRERMLRLAPMVDAVHEPVPPSGSRSASAGSSPWRPGTSPTPPSAPVRCWQHPSLPSCCARSTAGRPST